uniref:fimbrial protein n=1 Tax=Escherichia coli TaxID=562 RepID=UPI001FCE454F
CVCGKKIGPDPRNFNQRVSLGRNDLLIRTFLSSETTLNNGTNTIPFQARYFATGAATPGAANADATFKVQYQ